MKNIFGNAQWVWAENEPGVNQYADFIQDFTLEDAGRTILRISVDSQYAVWINGKFAGFGQYPDFPSYKVYDELDIGAFVRPGANRLCVLGYYQGESSSNYVRGRAGLIFAVTANGGIRCVSGKDTRCRRSLGYQSGPVEKFSPQLSFSFHYDARNYDGWREDGNGALPYAGFGEPVLRDNAAELYPRPVKKLGLSAPVPALLKSQGIFTSDIGDGEAGRRMRRSFLSFEELGDMTETKKPVVLGQSPVALKIRRGNGFYLILDLQKEVAGLFQLDIDMPQEAQIDIGFGEHLEDMRVRSYVGGRNFAFTYFARKGRQTFTHYFRRLGCRYVQLHVYGKEATVYYAGVRETPYPERLNGNLRFADSLHRRIFDVSVRTLHLCMHEHFEDTPWREQSLYAMDARIEMLCEYYCFGDYDFAKASLRLLAKGLREDGLLELCAPAQVAITIPFFSLLFVSALYEFYLFSLDAGFIREVLPTARKIMRTFLNRRDGNGLIGNFPEPEYWNFYEWTNGLDGGAIVRKNVLQKSYDVPLNAAFSKAAQGMAYLLRRMNKPETALKYQNTAEEINQRIHEAFLDEESNAYFTFLEDGKPRQLSQLAASMAVWCGACPQEKLDGVLETLTRDDGAPTPVSNQLFRYEALMTRGEKYGAFVFNDIKKRWGAMLRKGATSFWETEKGDIDFDDAGSLSHGWTAVPVYIYYAYGLGLRPCADSPEYYVKEPMGGWNGVSGEASIPGKKLKP